MNDDLIKQLKLWANGEAMAAYGELLVDHPEEHEGSQISDLIDTLTNRIDELEAKLARFETMSMQDFANYLTCRLMNTITQLK